jgi:hypothetical protein
MFRVGFSEQPVLGGGFGGDPKGRSPSDSIDPPPEKEDTSMLPVLCPGCRSPVPAETIKCPWCGRNVNQGESDEAAGPGPPDRPPS